MRQICFFSVVIWLTQCSDSSKESSVFPDQWTDSSSVKLSYSGGMMPESWYIEIWADSAIYHRYQNRDENTYHLVFSKEERNQLAHAIHAARPEFIEMKEHEIIYDMGTTAMILRFGRKVTSFGESATQSFTRDGGVRFAQMEKAVLELLENKLKDLRKRLVFELEQTGSEDRWLTVQVRSGDGSVTLGTAKTRDSLLVMPGTITLYPHSFVSDDGKWKYGAKSWNHPEMQFQLQNDTLIRFRQQDSVVTTF